MGHVCRPGAGALIAAGLAFTALGFSQSGGSRPPVVLVNGYQFTCGANMASSGTFGELEEKLRNEGVEVRFFNNCTANQGTSRASIEQMGEALGQFIGAMNVPQVDLVTHSMGGNIARAYLSGKRGGGGGFQPPAASKVRKLVQIAVPHFGIGFAELIGPLAPDVQVRQLLPASEFLWESAIWHQGTDDLRGVDAIAVAGNAGSGGTTDGLVPLTSASLGFAAPLERTRVVPYCHSEPNLLTLLSGGCRGALAIAGVQGDTHLTWRIVQSFLAGTDVWKSTGTSTSADPVLGSFGGVYFAYKTNTDALITDVSKVSWSGGDLAKGAAQVYYGDRLPPGPQTFRIETANAAATAAATVKAGAYSTVTVKSGPSMVSALPAAARVSTLNRAPGMFISIYGAGLATSTAQARGLPYPTELGGATVSVDDQAIPVQLVSPSQVNAVLPEKISGLVRLTVRNAAGSHSVNVLIEEAVPAVFSLDGSGAGQAAALNALTQAVITTAAPIGSGGIVALYLTGLGATQATGGLEWAILQPEVWVSAIQARVLYAGRAPGFPGLDQINFIVPEGLRAGAAELVVRSGARSSNVTTIALR